MAASSEPPKKSTAAKNAGTTKTRARAKKPATDDNGMGAAGDDADLRTRIARRAYEISQGADAGDDAENWLRAEREVRGT
jgi:hypothetical protein